MRLAIANSTAYCPPEILVRWLSGRKQRFAKAPYLSKGTEGSNPSLTASSTIFVNSAASLAPACRAPEIRMPFDRWGAERMGSKRSSQAGANAKRWIIPPSPPVSKFGTRLAYATFSAYMNRRFELVRLPLPPKPPRRGGNVYKRATLLQH